MLLGIGAITVRRTRTRAELAYAAIPLLFGIQQLVEGGLWLELPGQTVLAHRLAITYLLFSNVLWPVQVPVAVWLLEPRTAAGNRSRARALAVSLVAGAGTSLFFLYAIVSQPVGATIKGAHISYSLPHPHHNLIFAAYAVATCLAPLLSSHRMVRLLGVGLIASMIAARYFYTIWFASTWCYFAALLSVIVLLYFTTRERPVAAIAQ